MDKVEEEMKKARQTWLGTGMQVAWFCGFNMPVIAVPAPRKEHALSSRSRYIHTPVLLMCTRCTGGMRHDTDSRDDNCQLGVPFRGTFLIRRLLFFSSHLLGKRCREGNHCLAITYTIIHGD